MFYGVLNRI